MCGFAGLLDTTPRGPDAARRVASDMAQTLAHRGPDSAGAWADGQGRVGLAHQRLSILDLSACGAQPMASPTGRFEMAYNGEVYNFGETRDVLARGGVEFRGHSDTEVLLAGFEAWGVRETLERCVGMFALAVWDAGERELTLARDRMGQKPLYYGWAGSALVFGSELKALRAHPAFNPEIDTEALAGYFSDLRVSGPRSIYRGVRQLPPGRLLPIPADGLTPGQDLSERETAYWSLADVVVAGQRAPFTGTDAQAVDALGEQLDQAVGGRMIADVPLGAFLSGGIDSTAVAAAAQRVGPGPVRTYTIGFDDGAYDESAHAEAVAEHLGTEHRTLVATPDDALALVPTLGAMYDEPFADSSQIPTALVSALAREHVTVALSGDGADELFAGYRHHLEIPPLWESVRRVPRGARAAAGRALRLLSATAWDRLYERIEPVLPARARVGLPGARAHKLGRILGARSINKAWGATHRYRAAGWPPVPGAELAPLAPGALAGLTPLEQVLYNDTLTYLPDDILTKVDRASMSVSLECRAPFMDHRLVEFAWTLPERLRMRDGVSKWVLRQLVYRDVPRSMMDRPKTGFNVPIGEWLRGPLRPWAERLLDPDRLRHEGHLDADAVRAVWRDHLQRGHRPYEVWAILMFQSWLETSTAAAPARQPAPASALR